VLAASRSKWSFHFMGGGWCTSTEECTRRAYDPKECYHGSSSIECFNDNSELEPGKRFNETMDFRDIPCINGARWGGGLLMNSPETNPLTHDWNKVEMVYCDGGSYSGNNETASRVSYGGSSDRPLYYRGFRNLVATVDHLIRHYGFGGATHLVVSGDSAGGLAALWHADYFQTRLPLTKVLAVPDSGFFISDASKPAWPAALSWIATAMNSTAGLDQSCVLAADVAGRSPADSCTLPERVAHHVTVPIFVLNSRFDPALRSITSEGVDYNTLGNRVLEKLNASIFSVRENRNAAFITSCAQHCGQWAQAQTLPGHNDFNVTIDGWSAPFAVQSWAAWHWGAKNSTRRLWVQSASYPCGTCCAGGDAASLRARSSIRFNEINYV